MLLVALAVQGAAAAHGVGLGFVPVAPVVQAGHRWAGGGRGRQRVVTASSVQEPPRSSVPRSRSGEEEEGGGGNSNGGLGSVLSSLAKQRRLPPIPGAPWGLEPSEQPGQPVLASTPQPFSLETAVLLAPFAFEAYNDPARTEGTSW